MNKQEDPRQNDSALWFLLGTTLGLAAGFYLNSKRGRRFRRDMRKTATGRARQIQAIASDVGKAIQQRLSENTEGLRHHLEDQIETGKKSLRSTAKRIERRVKKQS